MTDTSTQPTLKLHAYIAQAGYCSRRKAEELIAAGKVRVNGQPAHIGQRVSPVGTSVQVEGKTIGAPVAQKSGYLIYKPVGVVSTTSDDLGRQTVISFLTKKLGGKKLPRLYPVGRLDLESEGLMLLTNDGALAQKLSHPSFQTDKTYKVTVEGRPTELALAHLERGVKLKEGFTAPAQIEVIDLQDDYSTFAITIHEGRHQQVRRMCERVGYNVVKLVRTHLGPFSLSQMTGKPVMEVNLDKLSETAYTEPHV